MVWPGRCAMLAGKSTAFDAPRSVRQAAPCRRILSSTSPPTAISAPRSRTCSSAHRRHAAGALTSRACPSVPSRPWRGGTGAQALEQGGLRLPSELLVRAHWACRAPSRRSTTRSYLEMAVLERVVAAFAAVVCALEVLDDRTDGDGPAADHQAPDVA